MPAKLFLLAVLLLAGTAANAVINPEKLTTEYLVNPLSIDVTRPRFGWMLTSSQRNQYQSAYEILVAETPSDLAKGRGTAWASGRIASAQNVAVVYSGTALKPGVRYFWKVRAYDQDGKAGDWSPVAWFETVDRWSADWIGDGKPLPSRDEEFYKEDPCPLFRKSFSPKKKIRSARLYISGLGYYEAFLNEKKIGDRMLEPGWTAHRKQVLYSVYDVTTMLKSGENTLQVLLGNGWYNPLPLRLFGRFNLRDVQQTGRPCLKACLKVTYADGSSGRITTDQSWETAPGPVLRNSVYLGEHYDARLERPANWKAAVVVSGPSGELTPQLQPPVRVTRVLKPVRITEPKPGIFVADMGQNFAGVARLRVQGPAGTRISLRYGEDVYPDGMLNGMTTVAGQIKREGTGGPGAPAIAWQEDSYILNGKGIETWSPRFTFHGFRYVELTGWPGKPGLADIDGLRMNADLPATGTFACSSELLNKINTLADWTFLSNVFSVQSDCPAREKLGYGGDIVGTAESYLYKYDMAQFYRKAVRDFANDQLEDGGITETAPFVGIADRGPGGNAGPLGWQLAYPHLIRQLYDFYGDRLLVEEQYPALRRQIEYLQSKAEYNLFFQDISDHEALDTKPEAFTAGAFYYHHARLMTQFAAIAGKTEDSVRYSRLAERIKGALVSRYLVPGTGRFDNATQTAQLFALWYGLAAGPEKDAALKQLDAEFARKNNHLSTGIFATKMLFDVLRENDRNGQAWQIASQEEFPGWGYMVKKGATTLWETWAYSDGVYSQNHPMFGSIVEWYYRSLLGINALEPGFARFQVKPQPAGDLTWAKGEYRSVRGAIACHWRKEEGRYQLDVQVPVNSTAEIWIPVRQGETVLENGLPAAYRILRTENGYRVYEVGSGQYAFSTRW
ncbi:family 78 glycoside hydrolase catalytic domain [Siphonobacter aquaeclarae]|uniref:alpha-L-rhamnosidase n=1 Tax=Siphonobacter aquaeclarae TaxID=563176 RepID=A0A1G9RK39_9BACT|nr:family 78 glycoside hydrolase catalytic domain [Siphonobacter aquaeclarae]SDM23277.1 alpha-L-rhamnosidase [Siphonobacter aquaeclarae]